MAIGWWRSSWGWKVWDSHSRWRLSLAAVTWSDATKIGLQHRPNARYPAPLWPRSTIKDHNCGLLDCIKPCSRLLAIAQGEDAAVELREPSVWRGSKVCRPSTQRASKQRSRAQRPERGAAQSL